MDIDREVKKAARLKIRSGVDSWDSYLFQTRAYAFAKKCLTYRGWDILEELIEADMDQRTCATAMELERSSRKRKQGLYQSYQY